MAAALLDVDYLSAYLNIPQPTLTTTIDAPTAELINAVLVAVTAKAREHDELAADKLRVDIELENAVRSSATRIEGLKAAVETAQKAVEEARTQLKEEENARSSLETELQAIKSSSSSSISELETLRTRIASLESANRDTVALLESKTNVNDNLAQDLQKQHQKSLELSQQITTLQQSAQNAISAASSAKFREQSLKQEVELAKRNGDWFEHELKTKNAEFVKFRKEKNTRISELQRLNEDANSTLEAMKRTEQILRGRLDEMQKKAEESLAKVQQLQEGAAKTEEGFRQELESSRRLAELQAQQTETHRNRLKEVEALLENARDDAAEEVGRCQQEVEVERQEREQAEQRITELEAEVDRLEALVAAPRSVPGTPRQGLNGSVFGRSGSPAPFGTPGSVRGKSAITATQAIDELYKVKGQLATEKRRGDRLAAEIEEMMQGLESKQPEIEELQSEYNRIQRELVDMSKSVDHTSKERDRAKKDARRAESEASTAKAESNILRQQLRDLSAQIKLLLLDQDAREKGLDVLTDAERSHLDRVARGEVSEDSLQGMTDTDRLISQRLTVFRNISELQEKNQELLRITRQLGAQMESEEALAAKDLAAKDHQKVIELQGKIHYYVDELKSVTTRSESYVKERDMFRRMLQHRGTLPPGSDIASIFGHSVDGNENVMNTTEQGHGSRENANYANLLRELQAHFDQYREEQSIDRHTMKEQTERLSSEKGSLQAEVAKVTSQLTHASERYEMLHSNYTMLQNENGELQKRSQILSEGAAKQDLRTQQVAEDLIEAKGIVESMRNENANLKAEKNLWKNIQDRLSQDNESLVAERLRLNSLVTNQQTLQNERELSESETRRRLQAQIESLESEMSATKRKLADEIEDNKKAQLRKEYDSQQNQKRIDDLAASLSRAREELVAAKTSRDHLQSRVDDLTIELKSAEERVEVLQPRPTPRPAESGTHQPEDSVNREQELAIEVSELKRDLELAKSELESAKNQMEQYKSISQSSEEQLESLNATQDQYREEMDRIIEGKDSKIREIQQRADDIASELANTNNELTALRNGQGEVARLVEEDKSLLEAEISRLKDEDDRHATAAQFHQQDLRAQAAIATKAQQDYENELVKHAEAAKSLQNLRAEHNKLKTETASLKADAESARVALSQSESSWEERREQFELEVKELRTRRDDANAQNKVLHQQLENVSAQISSLQQSRENLASPSQNATLAPEGTTDRNVDGLRELNTFLRREKEIVEVQYELKVQEAKRLQQQLDYAQSQLDESRLKLEQERRLHADSGRSAVAHQDLMEKLNELNLFRESSITLRNEARQAQTHLAEKTKLVEELLEQIQPLETKIRELEHAKETMDGEMQLLQADRDRWQKRTQDIISKYDRIDPAEMEQLKETIETLQAERDSLIQEQQPLQEKVQGFEVEKATWQASRTKIVDQAKERNRIQLKEIKDRTAERDAIVQEKESLQEQLAGIQQQLETVIQGKGSAEQQLASLSQELASVKTDRDQAVAASSQLLTTETPVAPSVEQADDSQLLALRKERDEAIQGNQALDAQLKELQQELQEAQSERNAAVADAADARSKLAVHLANNTAENGLEEGQVDDDSSTRLAGAERLQLEQRIAEAETKAKEQEEKASRIEAEVEATIRGRSEKMKAALNKKLVESRDTQKAELRAELEADYKLKLEQERKILTAELSATLVAPASTEAKSSQDAAPVAPATVQKAAPTGVPDASTWSDSQVRDFLATNPTVKSILSNNIKKKIELETEKLKQEQEKIIAEKLADAHQRSEVAKAQAVALESKKSTLKLSMVENRFKLNLGKVEIVQAAAKDTPQRPVVEVWEIVSAYKLPPAAPATPAKPGPPNPTNGLAVTTPNPSEPKAEIPKSTPQAPTQDAPPPASSSTPTGVVPTVPTSNLPFVPQPGNNGIRPSGIPMARGGNMNVNNRGRGGPAQIYQPVRGGGQVGKGRGGNPQRGGLNADAPAYTPSGPTGMKRPREEGSMGGPQGNTGKRPRGGGHIN